MFDNKLCNNTEDVFNTFANAFYEFRKIKPDVKLNTVLNDIKEFDNKQVNKIDIIDKRTLQIIKLYFFYQNDVSKIDNNIWFEAVTILNQLNKKEFEL